jgi:hypothetical protein
MKLLLSSLCKLRLKHMDGVFLSFQVAKAAKNEGKYIPVTGRGGPQGFETSRLSHFLDNRFIDGGKFVSLTRRPLFTPKEDSWYSFLLEAESIPGLQCGWKD